MSVRTCVSAYVDFHLFLRRRTISLFYKVEAGDWPGAATLQNISVCVWVGVFVCVCEHTHSNNEVDTRVCV